MRGKLPTDPALKKICLKAWTSPGFGYDLTEGGHWIILTPSGEHIALPDKPGHSHIYDKTLSRLRNAGLELEPSDKIRKGGSGNGHKPSDDVPVPKNLEFDRKLFAAALKQGREERIPKLSREDLAGLIGVSANAIWQWEHANSQPSMDRLIDIQKVFGWADPYGTPKVEPVTTFNGQDEEAEVEPESAPVAIEQLPLEEVVPALPVELAPASSDGSALLELVNAATKLVAENRQVKAQLAAYEAEVAEAREIQEQNWRLRERNDDLVQQNRRLKAENTRLGREIREMVPHLIAARAKAS